MTMKIIGSVVVKPLFILSSIFLFNLGWAADEIHKESAPAWVAPVELPGLSGLPKDKIENGVYYLLVDSQMVVDQEQKPQFYHHYADYIVNQEGVEESSQVNIDYDPSYQRLVLHSLHIIRDGKSIDKIDSARMALLHREDEMDDLIYNGRVTLNIILDDVRVGDIIEYGYSRQGMNPVFQNVFSYTHDLSWSVPVGRVSLRLLWNRPEPLNYQLENSELQLTHRKTATGMEYLVRGDDIAPIKRERNTPSWFNPWGIVIFSELNSWGEVARWSERLYRDVFVADDQINKLVADIQSRHKETDAQISAALRFVQDEIRYLGIELGENSHKPKRASVTLRDRYGDCKDKTVLLLTLLKGMGVKAYPVLVNTTQKLDKTIPSIRAFDHVITYFEYKGKPYWVDPTRRYQYGGIDSIRQPDYGYALILRPGEQNLTAMEPAQTKFGVRVKDRFVLHNNGGVEFDTESEYYGWNAEQMRGRMADKGREKLQGEYLEFFQRYYSGITVRNLIEYKDNAHDNVFSTSEQYQIVDFWKDKPEKKRYLAYFYSNVIASSISIPDEPKRHSPLHLLHPENIEQIIEVNFEDKGWEFDDEHLVEDNEFFRFSNDVVFDKASRRLTLNFNYRSKVDYVPSEKYQDYLAALKKASDFKNYSIYKAYPKQAAAVQEEPWYSKYLTATNLVSAYGLLYLLVFLLWRIDRRRNPDNAEAVFFPVSTFKFMAMWILTLGIYSIYWFYRNFKYIKEQEANATMPVWRGIFSAFWYYSLWNKLKQDNEERFEQSHLPGKYFAVSLALLYFAASIVEDMDSWTVLALLVSGILVLPLVNYIAFANGTGAPALVNNSRWSFRHYLLAFLSIPLLMLITGSDLGVLPNDAVVKGSRLLDYDIKLMQRRGILKANDEVEYFYSDAFLFVSDDGNGFTQRHVFSYWKDEKGSLEQEQATYDEIKDIKVDWERGYGGNTTLTIVRNDGSDFILFVSNTDHKDRLFVKAIKKHWQEKKGRME